MDYCFGPGGLYTLAINDVGDLNCAVVNVMQASRHVDVDPGDRFWLTVPVARGCEGVEGHREGDKGWTWLKAGEFLFVQYDEPGEYTICFRTVRARVLAPFTVRVFAPLRRWERVRGRNGQRRAGGGEALMMASSTSGPRFSVGSVYAGWNGAVRGGQVSDPGCVARGGGLHADEVWGRVASDITFTGPGELSDVVEVWAEIRSTNAAVTVVERSISWTW